MLSIIDGLPSHVLSEKEAIQFEQEPLLRINGGNGFEIDISNFQAFHNRKNLLIYISAFNKYVTLKKDNPLYDSFVGLLDYPREGLLWMLDGNVVELDSSKRPVNEVGLHAQDFWNEWLFDDKNFFA